MRATQSCPGLKMEEWDQTQAGKRGNAHNGVPVFPQILSVPKGDWFNWLDLGIACFATGVPLSNGYFLRSAQRDRKTNGRNSKGS